MYRPPELPPGGSVFQHGPTLPFNAYAFCDGAVKRGCGAFAYVLLDHTGIVRSTGGAPMHESTVDSTTAEFFGLVEAVNAAVVVGVRRLWVGTDSYQLVEHLNKRSLRYARFIAAIDERLPLFENLRLQAIQRAHNKQADALARKGIAHVR